MSKLDNGTQNFWSQVKNSGYFAVFCVLVTYLFAGGNAAFIVALCLAFWFLWLLRDVKQKLLRALPDQFQYEMARFEDYPLLNLSWFTQQSNELEQLGFVQLADYKMGKSSGFARCFSHPDFYCYSEISEVFTLEGESVSRSVVLFSLLDQGWSLSNIGRLPQALDGFAYGLWNNPKSVRLYHPPETPLTELLQRHSRLRQHMMNDLDISLFTHLSWQHYIEHQEAGVVARKKSLQRQNLLWGMNQVSRFQRNPETQWWGDYAKYRKDSPV